MESARSGAPQLQVDLSEEEQWFTMKGHLDPSNVLILIDNMNSGVPPRSARSGAAGDDFVRDRRLAYEKFVQLARQRFHKIIYVQSPPPVF